jgi:hypothetical protein
VGNKLTISQEKEDEASQSVCPIRKTKLSESQKLKLLRSLSAEDQKTLNPLLNAFDIQYDAKDGWLLNFHRGGTKPVAMPVGYLTALANLMDRVWPLQPPN